jgi:Arc/MetJ family transcription regulator
MMMTTEEFVAWLRSRDPATLDAEETAVVAKAIALDEKRSQVAGWLQEFIAEHPNDWQSPFKD